MPVTDEFINTTIGKRSTFEGKFAVKGSLRIDGRFEGEALEVEKIHIGVKGKVRTDIIASSVIVEGIVIGNIIASSRILLLPTSKILGDIKTPELIIQNGVILEGRCNISHRENMNSRQFIEDLYNQKEI